MSQRALALRRYEEEGALVIEVEDPFCPWNEGRFALSVDGDGVASVEPGADAGRPRRHRRGPELVVPGRCAVRGHGGGWSPGRARRRGGTTRRPHVRRPAAAFLHDALLRVAASTALRSAPARTSWACGAMRRTSSLEVRMAREEQHLVVARRSRRGPRRPRRHGPDRS